MDKLNIVSTWKDGAIIGLKNALSIIGAVLLCILTSWIPYINVGTTIAIQTLPIELSKGKVINPLFIFDSKYRKYMGEFFTTLGMMMVALIPAYLFMIIPGIIINIGWSLAILLLIDKGMAPGEALINSTKLTYGNKWNIFLINFVIALAIIVCVIFGIILGFESTIFFIISFILILLGTVISIGCSAIIYNKLTVCPANEE